MKNMKRLMLVILIAAVIASGAMILGGCATGSVNQPAPNPGWSLGPMANP